MENKTSKYFKYAIGEIILVVIGILIALQINNWNEQQQALKEEAKILNALKAEIKNNIENINETIEKNLETQKQSKAIFENYDPDENNDYVYEVKYLVGVFGYVTNRLDTSILEEILGTNSRALISNDETLTQLRKLKQKFNRAKKVEFYLDNFWNAHIVDFIRKSGLGIHINTQNIEDLKGNIKLDKDFFSLLGMFNASQESFLRIENELKKELETTLSVLNKRNW